MSKQESRRRSDDPNDDDDRKMPVISNVSLLDELEAAAEMVQDSRRSSSPFLSNKRRVYASLDVTSMGVDVAEGPKTNLDDLNAEVDLRETVGRLDRFIKESTSQLMNEEEEEKKVEKKEKDEEEVIVKMRVKKDNNNKKLVSGGVSSHAGLPSGWERHEDEEGPYFWHVKTGTIQRDRPVDDEDEKEQYSAVVNEVRSSRIFDDDFNVMAPESPLDERWLKSPIPPIGGSGKGTVKMQVQVLSLGWVEINEEELTPESSSKAVNRCIVELSTGTTKALHEPVGQWGRGNELVMELDGNLLKLVQPSTLLVLHSQPIQSIRVWGVGRDNCHDFAFVAKDRCTRKHMCHVFRCEEPARTIADALREACKKALIERSCSRLASGHKDSSTKLLQSFPTPMEDPKKILRGFFVGTLQVDKPSGMDIINGSIEELVNSVPRAEWEAATIAVAPSTITVSFRDSTSFECRIRFLSFLGIGDNPQQCAFVMHAAPETFLAHVFHCEPHAGPLCKTIEAACKLRYQKCLDARPEQPTKQQQPVAAAVGIIPASLSSIGTTLRSMYNGWTSS